MSAAIAAVLLTMMALAASATAQPYPSKPIHIIVPFAPGGITDVIGRALGQRLAEAWGQQVVVENKPGGGTGQVGTEYVAKSAPDGYTLMVTADATFVTAPHVYSKLPYDALNDFAPITGLGISPQALIVHPSLAVGNVGELVALAKTRPGAINYGTFGIGSSGHLNIILIEGMTGTKFTPVHYRGAAPGITDVIGGHIQMMIVSIGLITQPWQAGQLKVLGFGSSKRLPQYPDVPTLAESGLPGYAARRRRQAQRGDAAHLQRSGVPGEIPGAELHLLDCQLAGGIRRAHPHRVGEVGQGDQGCEREGGVTRVRLESNSPLGPPAPGLTISTDGTFTGS
jgi:tripartite-type tricarboxylate transporter receptor subunit TctC